MSLGVKMMSRARAAALTAARSGNLVAGEQTAVEDACIRY